MHQKAWRMDGRTNAPEAICPPTSSKLGALKDDHLWLKCIIIWTLIIHLKTQSNAFLFLKFQLHRSPYLHWILSPKYSDILTFRTHSEYSYTFWILGQPLILRLAGILGHPSILEHILNTRTDPEYLDSRELSNTLNTRTHPDTRKPPRILGHILNTRIALKTRTHLECSDTPEYSNTAWILGQILNTRTVLNTRT